MLSKILSWNGSSVRFTDTPFKKVLEDKKGSSSEINLLLASMLEKLDFNVNAVLVSTRDHGFVRQNSTYFKPVQLCFMSGES